MSRSERHYSHCHSWHDQGTIAPGASGKAAGFLALDWNDGTPTEALTRRSFALHQQLADRFGAESIQYRRVQCLSAQIVDPQPQEQHHKRNKGKKRKASTCRADVEWATQSVMSQNDVMGNEESVAQVTHKLLCESIWKACESQGCSLVKAKVTGSVADAQGKLEAMALEEEGEDGVTSREIPADALLYACGPWTADIMYGIKGHSLVLATQRVLKQSVFFYSEVLGDCELFVRPNATAFCSGFPDDMVKVTELPGQKQVEPAKAARLQEAVRNCSGTMGNLKSSNDNKDEGPVLVEPPLAQNACYQPVTDDFLPIIGALKRRASGCDEGCYMAGGNNCWGILLGPATGECMADLIATGKTSHVDIRSFRPSRYRNLKPVTD